MAESPKNDVTSAAATLAWLNEEARVVREEIDQLRKQLQGVKRDADQERGELLVAVNQQLVLAALRAESVAEIALKDLALINARHNRRREQRPSPTLTRVCAVAGFGLTLCVWYVAFAGRHALFSSTASAVAGGAVVLALGAWLSRRVSGQADFNRESGATREPSALAALQLLSVRSEVSDSSQAGMPVARHGRADKNETKTLGVGDSRGTLGRCIWNES